MCFWLLQPTVHFAEEPIIRGGDDDDDNENEDDDDGERSDDEARSAPFPAEKQRLIRKDTPHYKKHFKITKLPKPEAVAALLEGFSPDAHTSAPRIPNEDKDEEEEDDDSDEEEAASLNTPLLRRLEAAEHEDSRLSQVNSSLQPVKVRLIQRRKELAWWDGERVRLSMRGLRGKAKKGYMSHNSNSVIDPIFTQVCTF